MNMSASKIRMIVAAGIIVGGSCAADGQVATTAAEEALKANTNHVSNYVDLMGSLGYSTNPRLTTSTRNNGSTVLGRASAYAVHSVVTDRTTVNLSAFAENESYFRGGGSTQSFSLGANVSRVMSPRLTVYGTAGFSGDIGGQLSNRFISLPSSPTPVVIGNPLPPVDILNPTFISLNRKQYRISGQGGLSYRFSERDVVNASAGGEHVFFSGGGPSLDYDALDASLGWDRILSESSRVGVTVSAGRTDYHSRGHSTSVSPQITGSTQLGESWQASGSVGASFVQNETTTNQTKRTSLAFHASLCRTSPNDSICASASRSAQTAIGQGLVEATSASLSYFRRIGGKDTIQVGASASRSSGGNSLLTGGSTTYYGGTASYNRRLSPRLSTGVQGSVNKVDSRGISVPSRASAVVFLRYRLGDLQ